jgi:O-antigen/teichoic acid export membrane protein
MPTLKWDQDTFLYHWSHGSRLMTINFINAFYRNIFALVIGRFFSAEHLGYYNRADSFRVLTLNNTVGVVQTVSYPILARLQDDVVLLKKYYRRLLQSTVFITLPIFMVLITQARPIIEIVLTSKWLPSANILVVLSISAILYPFNSVNLNILKVKRRTDLFLRLEIIKKGLLTVIIFISVNLGFQYLVFTNLVIAIVALFLNNYVSYPLIRYSLGEQLADMWPLVVGFGVGVAGSIVSSRMIGESVIWLELLVGSSVGACMYLLTIYLIRPQVILFFSEFLRESVLKRGYRNQGNLE